MGAARCTRRQLSRVLAAAGAILRPFEETGAFGPARARYEDLAVRGAGAILFSGGVGTVLHVIAAITLARLLTPKDFGVVAMVTTFSLLLSNFGLNGFNRGDSSVRRSERGVLASNLFWINLGVGTLLTLAFAASGFVVRVVLQKIRLSAT